MAILDENKIPKDQLPEDFGVVDDRKMVEKHNVEYYKGVDECSKILVQAGLDEDFGARDRTMKQWAEKWERSSGATEEDLIAQNEGRR